MDSNIRYDRSATFAQGVNRLIEPFNLGVHVGSSGKHQVCRLICRIQILMTGMNHESELLYLLTRSRFSQDEYALCLDGSHPSLPKQAGNCLTHVTSVQPHSYSSWLRYRFGRG